MSNVKPPKDLIKNFIPAVENNITCPDGTVKSFRPPGLIPGDTVTPINQPGGSTPNGGGGSTPPPGSGRIGDFQATFIQPGDPNYIYKIGDKWKLNPLYPTDDTYPKEDRPNFFRPEDLECLESTLLPIQPRDPTLLYTDGYIYPDGRSTGVDNPSENACSDNVRGYGPDWYPPPETPQRPDLIPPDLIPPEGPPPGNPPLPPDEPQPPPEPPEGTPPEGPYVPWPPPESSGIPPAPPGGKPRPPDGSWPPPPDLIPPKPTPEGPWPRPPEKPTRPSDLKPPPDRPWPPPWSWPRPDINTGDIYVPPTEELDVYPDRPDGGVPTDNEIEVPDPDGTQPEDGTPSPDDDCIKDPVTGNSLSTKQSNSGSPLLLRKVTPVRSTGTEQQVNYYTEENGGSYIPETRIVNGKFLYALEDSTNYWLEEVDRGYLPRYGNAPNFLNSGMPAFNNLSTPEGIKNLQKNIKDSIETNANIENSRNEYFNCWIRYNFPRDKHEFKEGNNTSIIIRNKERIQKIRISGFIRGPIDPSLVVADYESNDLENNKGKYFIMNNSNSERVNYNNTISPIYCNRGLYYKQYRTGGLYKPTENDSIFENNSYRGPRAVVVAFMLLHHETEGVKYAFLNTSTPSFSGVTDVRDHYYLLDNTNSSHDREFFVIDYTADHNEFLTSQKYTFVSLYVKIYSYAAYKLIIQPRQGYDKHEIYRGGFLFRNIIAGCDAATLAGNIIYRNGFVTGINY